jgi:hypothetical protein
MMIINEITPEGVHFIDNDEQNRFIRFSDCNENWLAYRRRTEALSEAQISAIRQTDKIIGQRDVSATQNFIEFFTRPFTRFVFKMPEEAAAYEKLRDAIFAHGWRTHDLS